MSDDPVVAPSALLAVSGLHRSFGGLHAVAGATFAVAPQSITAVIGPNGAGKTTMFNLVSGFSRPDSGSVTFGGQAITGWSAHSIARAGLMRTFQLTKVLGAMSVLDNVLIGARDQPAEHLAGLISHPRAWHRRESANKARALTLLEQLRLADLAGSYAADLSGGQRKLLELARILMARPRLVLLDEPLAGVNPVLRAEILDTMRRLRDHDGLTFLFIEHDIGSVMTIADHVIVMADGRVIASGDPGLVRTDERVIEAYLGAAAARSLQ